MSVGGGPGRGLFGGPCRSERVASAWLFGGSTRAAFASRPSSLSSLPALDTHTPPSTPIDSLSLPSPSPHHPIHPRQPAATLCSRPRTPSPHQPSDARAAHPTGPSASRDRKGCPGEARNAASQSQIRPVPRRNTTPPPSSRKALLPLSPPRSDRQSAIVQQRALFPSSPSAPPTRVRCTTARFSTRTPAGRRRRRRNITRAAATRHSSSNSSRAS